MARLQRKKAATDKTRKKKPQVEETAAGGGAEATDTALAPPREAKKKTPPPPSRRPAAERKEPGTIRRWVEQSVQFLREVKIELKKVTWPSRKQTIGSTVVVIILVLIVSLFLGVVDVALSGLVRIVLQ